MLKTFEFTQLLSVKSIMRYLPAKGTAGLARFIVSGPRRRPSPPARMTALTFTYSDPPHIFGIAWHSWQRSIAN